jgi:hypothetical protein
MALDLKKLKEYLDSPQAEIDAENEAIKIKREEATLGSQLVRFHNRFKDRLDEVIEKLMVKYESDKYFFKERKLGYESRKDLYYFLHKYASKYSKPCLEQQYYNNFTGDIYYLGSHVIQMMYGQGSMVRIDKQNNPPIINEITPKMEEFLGKVYKLCREYGYSIEPNTLINNNDLPVILVKNEKEEVRLTHIDSDGDGK